MIVYMIQNSETGEWIRNTRNRYSVWTDKKKLGGIWTNKSHAIQVLKKRNIKAHVAEIVEFDMVEK